MKSALDFWNHLLAHAGPCSRTDPAQLIDRKGNRPWDSLISTASFCSDAWTASPATWEDFVDRFLGLVVHVIHHTSQSRSVMPAPSDVEDLAGEVFLTIIQDDFATLRHFRGESSLATYLTVVSRRIVVRELLKRRPTTSLETVSQHEDPVDSHAPVEKRISNREEVQRLLDELDAPVAEVVRLYHLEGKSYREIGAGRDAGKQCRADTQSCSRQDASGPFVRVNRVPP